MGKILCIETSADNCSVALGIDGKTIACEETQGIKQHASNITILIQKLLTKSKITSDRLDAIAISAGPGSYTGLRIGSSTAKGLCYALNIPFIAIDTLKSLAIAAINKQAYDTIGVLKLARGNEFYGSIYDKKGKCILSPKVLLQEELINLLQSYNNSCLVSIADDIKTNIPLLKAPNYSAKNMTLLAEEKFIQKDFEDTAYFEPYYLRPFVAVQSKK